MADRLIDCLESQYELGLSDLGQLPDQIGSYVLALAEAGYTDASRSLARRLLEIKPDPRAVESLQLGTAKEGLPRNPKPRFRDRDYARLLERIIPTLVIEAGLGALNLINDLIETALALTYPSRDPADDDYTWISRPAIENHEQNQGIDRPLNALITAARDASALMANNPSIELSDVVRCFDTRSPPVFKRLALNLVREHAEEAGELLTERLSDRDNFESVTVHHEYHELLRVGFRILSEPAQRQILGWIDEGPELDAWASRFLSSEGHPPTDAESKRFIDGWKIGKLSPVSDDLPADWKETYRDLTDRRGEPEHPGFVSYTSSLSVDMSGLPLAEELLELNGESILERLRAWEPSGKLMDAKPRDLGQEVRGASGADPRKLAGIAPSLTALSPEYLGGLYQGLEDAAKGGKPLHWLPIVESAKRMQARWEDESDEATEEEEGVRGAKMRLAWLLAVGFADGPSTIPFDLRDQVWEVLESLTNDADPDTHPAPGAEVSMGDPLTASLNTVRGQAMRVVGDYSRWVKQGLREGGSETADLLGHMPEVRRVLEHHLDPDVDASPVVRSVYGQLFVKLYELSPDWLESNLGRIFPVDPDYAEQRRAAWDGFLPHRPHATSLELLRPEYERAVGHVGHAGQPAQDQSNRRLAEHLSVYFLWGLVPLGSDSLITMYFENASDEQRGDVIRYVGDSFSGAEEDPPSDVVERITELWRWRNEVAGQPGNSVHMQKELAGFGWLFSSGVLDDKSALQLLTASIELCAPDEIHTHGSHEVVERLETLAPGMPAEVMQCLAALLVEGESLIWTIIGSRERIRQILGTVLKSPDCDAIAAAKGLVNRLEALGHSGYADLLDDSRPTAP